MSENRYRIAMVDDDTEDMYATRKGLEKGALDIEFTELVSAEALFSHLKRYPFSLPHLILLDINMPRMNGFEILQQLKETDVWCDIPTIMLSTSSNEADRAHSLSLGAAGFVTKFASMDALEKWGNALEGYLLRIRK